MTGMGWLPDRNSGAFWTLSCSCYQTRSSTSSCQISEYRKELNWITENSWNGSSMLRLLKRDIHGCTLTTGNRSWLLGYLDYEKLVILRYEITGSMSVSEERRTYPSPSPTTVNNQNYPCHGLAHSSCFQAKNPISQSNAFISRR